jgi:hypothetical protein
LDNVETPPFDALVALLGSEGQRCKAPSSEAAATFAREIKGLTWAQALLPLLLLVVVALLAASADALFC